MGRVVECPFGDRCQELPATVRPRGVSNGGRPKAGPDEDVDGQVTRLTPFFQPWVEGIWYALAGHRNLPPGAMLQPSPFSRLAEPAGAGMSVGSLESLRVPRPSVRPAASTYQNPFTVLPNPRVGGTLRSPCRKQVPISGTVPAIFFCILVSEVKKPRSLGICPHLPHFGAMPPNPVSQAGNGCDDELTPNHHR